MLPVWQGRRSQAGDIHDWIKRFNWQILFLVFNLAVLSITDIIPSTVDGRIWELSIDTVVGDNQSARKRDRVPMPLYPQHIRLTWESTVPVGSQNKNSPFSSIHHPWVRRSVSIQKYLLDYEFRCTPSMAVSFYTAYYNVENWRTNNPTGIRTHDPNVAAVDVSTTVRTLWKQFGYLKGTSHCLSKSIQWKKAWHNEWLDGHVEVKNTFVWKDTKNASQFRAACLWQIINKHIRLSFVRVWSNYKDRCYSGSFRHTSCKAPREE